MQSRWAIATIFLLLSAAMSHGAESVSEKRGRYEEILLFEDEFNEFDLSKWKHGITLGGNGNNEFEVYVNSRNNSYVRDGKLFIKPTLLEDSLGEDHVRDGELDIWGLHPASACTAPQFNGCLKRANNLTILPPIQSARIRTSESFSFKYGRVEVKAKLPKGDWIWPAIWMMPQRDVYGSWPSSGELDIMESRGNPPSYVYKDKEDFGYNSFTSCFHFGPKYNKDAYTVPKNKDQAVHGDTPTYGDKFFTYGVYWDDKEMYTYLDDPDNKITWVPDYGKVSFWEMGVKANFWNSDDSFNVYQNARPNAPFDQEMFLIFNVAIGGTSASITWNDGYFPDNLGGKPWKQVDPYPALNFYNAKDKWYPTWTKGEETVSDDAALQIESVKVWGFKGVSSWTYGYNNKNQQKDFDECTGCSENTRGNCKHNSNGICYNSFASGNECLPSTSRCSSLEEEKLIFSDNFETMDLSKWKHSISMSSNRKDEFQMHSYLPENSYVKQGTLFIQPTLTATQIGEETVRKGKLDIWGGSPSTMCTGNSNSGCFRDTQVTGTVINPVTAAQLSTIESFSFTYGRVEIRAKFPKGDWIRPSLILTPKYNAYGDFPLSGEVVMAESMGNEISSGKAKLGRNTVSSSAYFGPYMDDVRPKIVESITLNEAAESFDGNYHTFGLYWDENEMYTYLDEPDNVIATIYSSKPGEQLQDRSSQHVKSSLYGRRWKNAPFDQPMSVTLSLAVGGSDGYFPDSIEGKPWKNDDPKATTSFYNAKQNWIQTWRANNQSSPEANDVDETSAMKIDSVKVWSLPNSSSWTYHRQMPGSSNSEFLKEHENVALAREERANVKSISDTMSEKSLTKLFSDTFEELDMRKWKPEITLKPNPLEFQMYVNSRRNSFVKVNVMHIQPSLTSDIVGDQMMHSGFLDSWGTEPASQCTSPANSGCGVLASDNHILNPVQTSRLRTAESFSFMFGQVEIAAMVPSGDWLLPSIQLVPLHDRYGVWPKSGGVSLLSRGRNDSTGEMYYLTSICSASIATDQSNCQQRRIEQNVSDGYHLYGLLWDENHVAIYLDSPKNVINSVKIDEMSAEFGETFRAEMYLAVGLAVGEPHSMAPATFSNARAFIDAKSVWWRTWSNDGKTVSDEATFKISQVHVYGFGGESKWTFHRFSGDDDIVARHEYANTEHLLEKFVNEYGSCQPDCDIISIAAEYTHPHATMVEDFKKHVSAAMLQEFGAEVVFWGLDVKGSVVSTTITTSAKIQLNNADGISLAGAFPLTSNVATWSAAIVSPPALTVEGFTRPQVLWVIGAVFSACVGIALIAKIVHFKLKRRGYEAI